jgi:hypothetical protein
MLEAVELVLLRYLHGQRPEQIWDCRKAAELLHMAVPVSVMAEPCHSLICSFAEHTSEASAHITVHILLNIETSLWTFRHAGIACTGIVDNTSTSRGQQETQQR